MVEHGWPIPGLRGCREGGLSGRAISRKGNLSSAARASVLSRIGRFRRDRPPRSRTAPKKGAPRGALSDVAYDSGSLHHAAHAAHVGHAAAGTGAFRLGLVGQRYSNAYIAPPD
jgi:hypothetical protein